MNLFDRFQNRTIIRATLEMQTALSVGSRLSLEPTGTDMPVVKGPDGLPFIPGSSIKGVVRFQAERILRTINRPPKLWACDPFGDPCVPEKSRDGKKGKDRLWEESGKADDVFAQEVWKVSCTACRLFGSPWFAGRVAFKDAYLVNADDLPVPTQIRDGVGIDRDLGAARTGVKYDFETVVPGARFGIEVLTENLEDWEIGFLLAVLQMWEEGGIALGGKTTRGPGWGKLDGVTIQRVDPANLMDYLLERKTQAQPKNRFLEALRNQLGDKEVSHA
ncbi:MAG: type III CRISPR-associated RAMP protein Csx7 [Anaerolineae bacterium]